MSDSDIMNNDLCPICSHPESYHHIIKIEGREHLVCDSCGSDKDERTYCF